MSVVEWKEVQALTEFAKAGIAYDVHAAYVAQVFTYLFLQPGDLIKDRDTQAAFAAVDHLATEARPHEDGGDIVLGLPKAQMRQMLMMLGMAAESEDQAEIINDGKPDEFPHKFPDIEISSSRYARAFFNLLDALYENRTLNINRPYL